jgi:signal transduction histidine kinase
MVTPSGATAQLKYVGNTRKCGLPNRRSGLAKGPLSFKPWRFRPHNLNQALSWLLASVIVPLLLGALALLVVQAQHERQLAQTQISALAQTLLNAVERELDHGRAQLEVLAAAPVIDRQDWQLLHRFAGDVAQQRPGSLIGLTGPDGQQLLNTAMRWGEPQPNLWKLADQRQEVMWEGRSLPLSSQNVTRQVFETGKVVYSDLYYGLFIQRPTLAVSVPVQRDGKVLYALTLSFPPALLDQLIRSSVNAPGLRAAVVDRKGVVVASNAAASSRLGDKMQPITMEPGASAGNYDITARDGTRLRGAYAVSAHNGFVVRVAFPLAVSLWPSRATSAGWAALVIAALAASVLLAGFLGRRIAKPLRELGQAAREGRLPADPRDSGIHEIDVLSQALRAGAEAERQRREQLIVSSKRIQEEAALRKAARQKDEFLATLAHELRNPLGPIRTAVELIRRRNPPDPTVRRARDVIERQVSHLSRLVDDLLDVSRITLGTIHLRKELLDLGAVAAGAAESVRSAADAAGLTMKLKIPQAVTVNGDPTRLAQCIVNLLHNAVKFTPHGGHIVLRVAQKGATAVVDVSDSGIGIAPENLERIFELFVQEQTSGSHGNTGLGIGLALTRRLIALHGGTVKARSAGTGQGTTLRIELPAVSAPAPAPVPHAPTPAPSGGGARVLVVDDNRDAADVLKEMLAMSGFHSTVAYDGETAVQSVEQQPPDAVLLDIGLPGIDGYEVCRRIRQANLRRQPAIIALTGWGQESDREQASAAGFDAHLTKPADPERIIALLTELIRIG